MEWVETTAKTVDEARDVALDRLGVGSDEAEFEILDEPRPGLFGRVRGEARVRARVKPAQVRPKQERRRRGRSGGATSSEASTAAPESTVSESSAPASTSESGGEPAERSTSTTEKRSSRRRSSGSNRKNEESTMNDEEQSTVSPAEVGAAAVTFMEGLTQAFGAEADVDVAIDELELDVTVTGNELGLLVGPSGRTLNAVQDLARVAAQRRLGDHETRLRIDVGGYRARREAALADFARNVAEQVRESGTARSLEPMASADRKVVHDVLNDETGVSSRSVGDDPDRRIIVEPA